MKTITLTAKEYIEFCAYYEGLSSFLTESITTCFIKNRAIVTASESFLSTMGY